jgi:hypothetical protein
MSEIDVFWRENMQLLQSVIVGVSTAAACANYTLRGE